MVIVPKHQRARNNAEYLRARAVTSHNNERLYQAGAIAGGLLPVVGPLVAAPVLLWKEQAVPDSSLDAITACRRIYNRELRKSGTRAIVKGGAAGSLVGLFVYALVGGIVLANSLPSMPTLIGDY